MKTTNRALTFVMTSVVVVVTLTMSPWPGTCRPRSRRIAEPELSGQPKQQR